VLPYFTIGEAFWSLIPTKQVQIKKP
jgi:hypothetical protein